MAAGGNLKLGSVSTPSSMIMIGEAENEAFGSRDNVLTNSALTYGLQPHTGGLNTAFVDGHVDFYKWFDIFSPSQNSLWTRGG